MKFKVGDKVHSLVYERDGEIIYADNYDTMSYLVGFKGLEGHSGKSAPDYIKSEIKRKGYENQCKWCSELMLEPVKEEKKMRNIDIIVNDKKLNDISVCRACYKLKNNMNCDIDVSCPECEFNNNKNCYEFLNAEYKPKIVLTKFEYDLLVAYNFREDYCTFNYFDQLRAMKEKGYFKNVTDTSMKINDILANCEIEEDK